MEAAECGGWLQEKLVMALWGESGVGLMNCRGKAQVTVTGHILAAEDLGGNCGASKT